MNIRYFSLSHTRARAHTQCVYRHFVREVIFIQLDREGEREKDAFPVVLLLGRHIRREPGA